MSTEAAVRLAEVGHRYGGRAALEGIGLTVERGAVVGLIGPDGVGKSTVLGLIAGVRRIQQGVVEVLGGDMASGLHRNAVAARIAYMPQGLGRNLYASLSIAENVDFFGRLFGMPPGERARRGRELLQATGLAPFRDRPASNLSGGMKQKLALCCALIHQPDLLILDEPTTGIDPLSRRQFWELIDRLKARSPEMTVIAATAYMAEAEAFEWLWAMDGGRILAAGTPKELKELGGCERLEEAFVALLPPERRVGHEPVVLPPRRPSKGPPAIEAEGLTKRFGDFTAVDAVSFRIEPGEIFGFVGSNGCGKTTTMKMLTGLLTPSAGEAWLFGKPMERGGLELRRRVGYMSQSFSLYRELSVRQNLRLHAQLFDLPPEQREARVAALLERFELKDVATRAPSVLPLGVRQRLQLAVAVLHRPEMLILDEPTSGVDPVARDHFWSLLIGLSRDEGVTIFISTHFMNEAERCDRLSLMHAGRVLAVGTPAELQAAKAAGSLDDAFVAYLEEAGASEVAGPIVEDAPLGVPASGRRPARTSPLSPARVWAFARREATELLRDPIRLAFAFLGPLVLMLAMGYGISFDVENLTYAALDEDRSRESRLFLQQLSSSRYFEERAPLESLAAVDQRLLAGDIGLAIVVPPDFGRDLLAGRTPEVAAWLDGSNTSRAETARGYVEGLYLDFLKELAERESGYPRSLYPVQIETRFRYNQAFRSIFAIPPGVLTMMLIMVPAMLTALGVVREKELGSITNLYAAPVSRLEFLIGKQLPYVAVAMASFLSLLVLMIVVFQNSVTGSALGLALGALLYTTAATAFGLVVSTFVRSQIAAIFATAIIVMIPTVNFSGMLYPVATLEGGARLIGELFPALHFQKISAGVFNKGLGLEELLPNHLALVAFCFAYWTAAALLLRKQEA